MRFRTLALYRYPTTTTSVFAGGSLLVVFHFLFGATFENPIQIFLDQYVTLNDLSSPPISSALLILLGISVATGLLAFGVRTILANGFQRRHGLVTAAGYVLTPGLLVLGTNAAIGVRILVGTIVAGSVGGFLVGVFLFVMYLFFGCVSAVGTMVAIVPGGVVAGGLPLVLDYIS